jgi:hypothetical protein
MMLQILHQAHPIQAVEEAVQGLQAHQQALLHQAVLAQLSSHTLAHKYLTVV